MAMKSVSLDGVDFGSLFLIAFFKIGAIVNWPATFVGIA
jgi:hypothetical protein